jgi:hypothetical protein
MSNKHNRTSYIDHRATLLAASGLFVDWRGVEEAIVLEGYPEAVGQLNNPARRARLDRVCAKARKADDGVELSTQENALRQALLKPRSVHYTELLMRMKNGPAPR